MSVDSKAEKSQESGRMEIAKVIVHALILAVLVRIFLFQPFNIPSGSMKETLLVGDYLFVSKHAYGYSRYTLPFGPNVFSGRIWSSQPERGDVVVFKLPRDTDQDYIKRVIGLPGDRVQMRLGQLYINGDAVPKVRDGVFEQRTATGRIAEIPRYKETLPNGVSYHVLDVVSGGSFDDTSEYTVPDGHYFMMGDNRDNSIDSRALYSVGYVPDENLVGRAEVIFFSHDETWSIFKPWTWPSAIRWGRFFDGVR